ncbi:hypothetical protein GCM10017786_22690 [Amycolatopsis deserti]|uniref:OmpR/PhoB-type domain-containing protein n=1 Tax=Amycolatopsis deserti TaxID=185696 RepID=A0ABQ3IPS5_9PSEU|nr:AfsR/SARP family transcriptional regulator [Amycolatopsis deserti]GHE89946.1 hypothetical protein GCM10017786_22690 [Amycolatopsis deserti]
MEFRILGPLEVRDTGELVPLPRGRGRALLALLVVHAGQVVATDRLTDELWQGNPPPTAGTALQGLVSNLRKRLGGALIRTRPPGYALTAAAADIDANRFRVLVDAAAGAGPRERADLLRRALRLWRGPVLAEFRAQPFAQPAIAALDELRLSALEERIGADLALGRHPELVGELEALVEAHPLRERLRGQLMLALYRTGRQVEALGVYRAARSTLAEELGLEPGPGLRGLEVAILRQDPALLAPG